MTDALTTGSRAIFLDRDGTLNQDNGYTHRAEDLCLLPKVIEGLQSMSALGFRLFVISNQAGVAHGHFTLEAMDAFNQCLWNEISRHGITLTGIYCCPYHPAARVSAYRRHSTERKPQPGMFLRAAKEHHLDLSRSYAVGDKKSDILAARAAGCTSILVLSGYAGQGEEDIKATPDYVAHNLLEAADFIRRREGMLNCQ